MDLKAQKEAIAKRAMGRRASDRLVMAELRRYRKAFHVGQVITSEINKEILLEVIIHQINEVMEPQRSTVFIYDDKTEELWSEVAVGMKKREIRIPADYGVAGWVFKHGTPVIVNDAYHAPRFYAEVDKKSGFRTKKHHLYPPRQLGGKVHRGPSILEQNRGRL